MLNGAVRTIKMFKPKIAITTYHNAEHARQIAAFLKILLSIIRLSVKG